MATVLGMVKTNGNGEYEEAKSLAGTYGIIFAVNLLFEIMIGGGIGVCTYECFGNAIIQSLFTMLVIYASNKGINWKNHKEK